MSGKPYILGVDDEETNRIIMEEIFEDDYELLCVNDAQSCFDSMVERKPDLILLDVNMPVMDGLEACRKIRGQPESKDIPIIFVSALASAEERMAGYEAGGDDYVTKPFVSEELQAKVDGLLKRAQSKAELEESSNNAMQTAMMAMTNASELGLVIRFLQESFECSSYESLTSRVFEYIDQYGLNSSLFLSLSEGKTILFSDGIERPLEASVFDQLKSKGRIYSFGNKIILNGERASLLIKDLPDDTEKVGRFRDHLAVFLDGIDARLRGIEIEMSLSKKQQILSDAITGTQTEIQEITAIQRKQQAGVVNELSNIGSSLEESFMTLGLTDEQESFLVKMVADAEKNTEVLYRKGLDLDRRFADIINKLQSVL